MIGSTLLFIGILVIFIGFLTIMVSIALSILQDSRSRQDHFGRTESELFRKGASSGENLDSSRYSHEEFPAGKPESKVKGGGVILIGPIPIIFGSDKESAKTAVILAIILMLLSLLFMRGCLF